MKVIENHIKGQGKKLCKQSRTTRDGTAHP